ncbi:PIN domain-containing protein [Nostoc sphaeroides CCNUC1]|uniref:PIN domain-containing protein n=1 Tax=Nostoc sphaeroides CCNUC1 TaxID=2653204 RepID=A0A5P8W495_9NOSO|nr:PIN domain-containing protein [Nostoc sphaeroides CCNUC1]
MIALINQSDANHQRCVDILPQLLAPLLTTWSCFTEAMYLLGRYGGQGKRI